MSDLCRSVMLLMVMGAGLVVPAFGAQALTVNEASSLVRLRVQHQMDTVEVFRKSDGRWWVAGRDLPAIPDLATQTIRQLEALEEKDPLSLKSEADVQKAGLQLERARFVRLTFSDGKIRWLRLGEPAGSPGTMTWARDAGNPLSESTPPPRTAFRTTGIPIVADVNSWTTPILFPLADPEDVDSLQVAWRDGAGNIDGYSLARKGDQILILGSPFRVANSRKALEQIGQAVTLLIDQFVEPGESVPARSEKPRVKIRIVLRNGNAYDLSTVASDAHYDFVPHPEAPDVLVKLRRVRFDTFTRTSEYLATSYPYGPEEDDGITGPPPPGFGVIAPHGHQDEHEHADPGHVDHGGHDHSGHDHSGHNH